MNPFKKKIDFVFSQEENISVPLIVNTKELIRWAIQENAKAHSTGEHSQILVESKNSKGKTLYAYRFLFPADEDFDYDEALDPFYSSKLTAFDSSVYEPRVLQKKHYPKPVEEKGYAPVPQLDLSDNLPPKEVEKTVRVTETVQEHTSSEKELWEELKALKAEFEARDQMQKERIQELEANEAKILDVKETESSETVEKPRRLEQGHTKKSLESIFNEAKLSQQAPPLASVLSEDEIDAVLSSVRESFTAQLSSFMKEEKDKIEKEIKTLDGRESIVGECSKRSEIKLKAALLSCEQSLQVKTDEALKEAKSTYEKLVEKIKTDAELERIKQKKALREQSQQDLEAEIATTYEKQTHQLQEILKGKTQELNVRQSQLMSGLKENFEEVLKSFDSDYGQLIQGVEQEKDKSGVIPLTRQRTIA
ncbi:hypothetical protein ACI1TM_08620 [Lactococcus garvieae]|uniref:hypothetical protein n=1 Tax=Lactococcus garvieae TaxID=1363 RepID=UPI003852FB41